MKNTAIKALPATLLLSLVMMACNQSHEPIEIATDELINTGTSNQVIITKEQFAATSMQVGGLTRQPFSEIVHATGMLDVPPGYKSSVSAYFGGYIKKINLLPGQTIRKGQLLFTLENPEYVQMQQDFLKAKNQLSYLKSDYERQKDLVKDNVTSEKTYLKSQSEYFSTQAEYEALKRKLALININPDKITPSNISASVSVFSPISGFITAVHGMQGMYLNPEEEVVTITNTDHLHIELSVFEKDLPKVKVEQPVTFYLQDYPQKVYDASTSLVNQAIDPEKRTTLVHCHLENEDEAHGLVPGMFVEADIYTKTDSVWSLPAYSVVSVEDKHYVLLKTAENDDKLTFLKKEVKIGTSNDHYVSILNANDFPPNSEFLLKGAFNLIKD